MFPKRTLWLGVLLGWMCFFGVGSAYSQFAVTSEGQNGDPEHLVQNVLIGEGVAVSNIQSAGVQGQFGYFTGGEDIFGFPRGVIISNGLAEAAPRSHPLNGSNQEDAVSYEYFESSDDEDLLTVSQETSSQLGISTANAINDVASVSFDFIPTADEVSFQFVFASEEYPDYIESKFNDVFGFFVAGPEISGPYTAPLEYPNGSQNLALVPGQNLGITVSSVNEDRNRQFYVDNTDGQFATHFNGFTTTITVTFDVVSCQKHHFRFAIGDGTDFQFDSAILLQEGGFTGEKFNLTAESTLFREEAFYGEGCAMAQLEFTRLNGFSATDSLSFNILPTSQADANDFGSSIPDFVVFQPGDTVQTVTLEIVNDELQEGDEIFRAEVQSDNSCFQPLPLEFTIRDFSPLRLDEPALTQEIFTCADNDFNLVPQIAGGFGFYQFEWLRNGQIIPAERDSAWQVEVFDGDEISVRITDTCISTAITKTWEFVYNTPDPLLLYLEDQRALRCSNQQTTLAPDSVRGGEPPYSYRWYLPDGTTLGTNRTLQDTFPQSTEVILQVNDVCGLQDRDTIEISVQVYPPYELTQNFTDTLLCQGESIPVMWNATGGAGNYQANWGDNFNGTSNTRVFKPSKDTVVSITVAENCGLKKVVEYLIDVIPVKADFEIRYENDRVNIENYSIGDQLSYQWFYDGVPFSETRTPMVEIVDTEDHWLLLQVRTASGCTDSLEKLLAPPLELFIPTGFTPNEDGLNDTWRVYGPPLDRFLLEVYDRFGQLLFRTTEPEQGWDGRLPGTNERVQGTFAVYILAERGNQRIERRGSFTLVR